MISAAGNSNLDKVLRGLVETGGVISECIKEINGFTCNEDQLSGVRSIIDSLRDMKPIVASSTEETLNQNLEEFFSNRGYSLRLAIIALYLSFVAVAVAAGSEIPEDLPGIEPLSI